MNISNDKIPNDNKKNNRNEMEGCLLAIIIIVGIIALFISAPVGMLLIIGVGSYSLINKGYLISKKKIQELEKNIYDLENHRETLNKKIEQMSVTKEQIKFCDLDEKIKMLEKEYLELSNKKDLLYKEVITAEDNLVMQSFGFSEPEYNFESSEKYKIRLEIIRKAQKEMVREKTAMLKINIRCI